jgi:FKBP-type peptidyl-prolyl cis-trans isomerase FklB
MKHILLIALSLTVATVQAQDKKAKPATKTNVPAKATIELKNGLDSFSYAAGVSIANNMKEQGISELNLNVMMQAFDDVLKNKPTFMNNDQCGKTLQQKLQEFSQKKTAAQKEKGIAFLNENKKRTGVISLPNGLQYEVITAGDPTGMKPNATDTVEVHYVGTLIDGTEFDNSIKRGQTISFPLNGVIKGWTEILQLMTVGSKWKVYIPSELGYGERGAGAAIPGNSTLIFEIDLKGVKRATK